MSKLNWGMIQDGGTFESLMQSIIGADDPGAILFGRPGPDGGQDARSSNGSTVYQAKYRKNLTMDIAIALALSELKMIKKYKKRDHPNSIHWKNVREWILVANFSINPNDRVKWDTKVTSEFQKENLTVDFWSIETIEGKLALHPHVREVFFEGKNRILIGLKEAYDLLNNGYPSRASLNKPFVGRDDEIQIVEDFIANDNKSILPVIGSGGLGKSRLLFESLVLLGDNGWRVLWALPGTMARSTSWFHLLNSNQKTCIAIDDPDDPDLLRLIVEQLAAFERKNWKILIAFRQENAMTRAHFANNKLIADPLHLKRLDEASAKQLVEDLLPKHDGEAWLHNVYTYTKGIPGWLCLVAELASRQSLSSLSISGDEIASGYVESCLKSIDSSKRDKGRELLRWLSLWGTLKLEEDSSDLQYFTFLNEKGVSETIVRDLLGTLTGSGLIRNWGMGKRLYAIEPLIIREYILSDWLFQEEDRTYKVSAEGKLIVQSLINSKVPGTDNIFGTLSYLTRSRLETFDSLTFLKPIFHSMKEIAKTGSLMEQYRIANLVESSGATDPESALEILSSIRKNKKESMEVGDSLWGHQTFTHEDIVSKLPWYLYQLSEYVFEANVAMRYLIEFKALIILEEASCCNPGRGKEAKELVKRLLCRSKNWELYALPAFEIVKKELNEPTSWPFVKLLLESLLNPEREHTEWVTSWQLSIVRRIIVPKSDIWNMNIDLRKKVFTELEISIISDLRSQYWNTLAESHHQFHRLLLHGKVSEEYTQAYKEVLIDDLMTCLDILKKLSSGNIIEETTQARKIWKWYLKYGRDDDICALAQKCEDIYNNFSKWRLHDFFQFDTEENLYPETLRITDLLKMASDISVFDDFFYEAQLYLDAVRSGGVDGADMGRISAIADKLCDLFLPSSDTSSSNTLTVFVKNVLNKSPNDNKWSWAFSIRICQKFLCCIKKKKERFGEEFQTIMSLTDNKSKFLFDLYSNSHPDSNGYLNEIELDNILKFEKDFSHQECFILFSTFAFVHWEKVRPYLLERLISIEKSSEDTSRYIGIFIQFLWVSFLRFKWPTDMIPMKWIVDMIWEYNLDGALLERHDIEELRDKIGFRLSMSDMLKFLIDRIKLEKQPEKKSSFREMPNNFPINKWCLFDATNPEDVTSFNKFCSLIFESGFIVSYYLPEYVSKLDPSGQQTAMFVEGLIAKEEPTDINKLNRLSSLASKYPDTTKEWSRIAKPICKIAQLLPREDRYHIYFNLNKPGMQVISGRPGEVSDYYIKVKNDAINMRNAESKSSPLMEYRERKVFLSEAELKREKEIAEEVTNG